MNDEKLLTDFMNMIVPSIGNVLRGNDNSTLKIPVDISNDEKSIQIYAELPGVRKESINIDFYNNKVTITAEKGKQCQSPDTTEIKYGRYERVITLPICITSERTVSRSYVNGILKITINKLIEEENKFSVGVE